MKSKRAREEKNLDKACTAEEAKLSEANSGTEYLRKRLKRGSSSGIKDEK